MKELIKLAAILFIINIIFTFPGIIPIVIFGVILYFTFTQKGKDLFDIEKWKKEGIDITKMQDKPTKNEPPKIFKDIQNLFKNQQKNVSSSNFPPFSMKFTPSTFIVFLFLVVFAIIADGIVNVPAGSVAVIFDRGSGVLERPLNPGIHLKIPFWQTATIMETRLQEVTISESSKTIEPISALTSDGQQVNIDITVQYLVGPNDAPKVYSQIGLDYIDKIVTPGVRSIVREVITGYDTKELFAEKTRVEVETKITSRLEENYKKGFISLQGILVRNVRFSDSYLKSIEEKKIAEQQVQKAEYEKQEAQVRKEKTIIEAEAQAESIRLKGESLKNSPEVIQLQFVEKMAPNISWGILPDGAVPLIDTSKLQKQ